MNTKVNSIQKKTNFDVRIIALTSTLSAMVLGLFTVGFELYHDGKIKNNSVLATLFLWTSISGKLLADLISEQKSKN